MKLLVIQEQHFTKLPNGEVWVDRQSERKFWDRYLDVFEEIVVCARMQEATTVDATALRSDRDHVSFVGLPEFRGMGGLIKNYFEIQRRLRAILKDVDCVIFRAPSPISMVCYEAVRHSGKPFAVELMNNPRTHYSADAMKKFYQPAVCAFIVNQTERMCRSANGVAYVTQNVLQTMYPSTAHLYGESSTHFESSYSTIHLTKNDYRKSGWPQKRPEPVVLVHSGAMADYRKGQKVFIDALSILSNKGYKVQGVLIGDGIKHGEFEKYTADQGLTNQVKFAGWKAGFKNVQEELLKGQIFVFPSLGEGLPRSLIEAMASGMLCFGSAVDGVCELLSNDQLVNEFSGVAFADKIEPYLIDWTAAGVVRDAQYATSLKYEASILRERRTSFYQKLKNLAVQQSEKPLTKEKGQI